LEDAKIKYVPSSPHSLIFNIYLFRSDVGHDKPRSDKPKSDELRSN
jgi:hypothetical protein